MKECYVLMEYSNEEGICGVSVYYNRKTAFAEAKEDAESIMREFENDGYMPVLSEVWDGYEVYVIDTDINYEWKIREAAIK